MYMNDGYEGILAVGFVLVLVLAGVLNYSLEAGRCARKWGGFENKYGYWEGCQIKLDGKWIPSESYYFKEE